MLVKQFKNGNIHVKYESDCDDYKFYHTVNPTLYSDEPTYADMVCAIYNCIDLDCLEYDGMDSYYGIITIINHAANDTKYNYPILMCDMHKFFSGRWVILHPIRK